ncbi:MAG: hypothetical protein HY815_28250 [Candidatus Riflebacteria bacterium]|nr:hypothetical protein [Candidatus Riflebacteria bacterium]
MRHSSVRGSRRGIATIWLVAGAVAAAGLGYVLYQKYKASKNQNPAPASYTYAGNQAGQFPPGYEQPYANPYNQGYIDPTQKFNQSPYALDYGMPNPYQGYNPGVKGVTPFSPDSTGSNSPPLVDRETFHKRLLDRFDEDHDGKLSDSERQKAEAALGPWREQMAAQRKAALARFDKNGDGKLDDEEKAQARQAWQQLMSDPELRRLFEAVREAHAKLEAATASGDKQQLPLLQKALQDAHKAFQTKRISMLH